MREFAGRGGEVAVQESEAGRACARPARLKADDLHLARVPVPDVAFIALARVPTKRLVRARCVRVASVVTDGTRIRVAMEARAPVT